MEEIQLLVNLKTEWDTHSPRCGSLDEGAPEKDSGQKAETTVSLTAQYTLTWWKYDQTPVLLFCSSCLQMGDNRVIAIFKKLWYYYREIKWDWTLVGSLVKHNFQFKMQHIFGCRYEKRNDWKTHLLMTDWSSQSLWHIQFPISFNSFCIFQNYYIKTIFFFLFYQKGVYQ